MMYRQDTIFRARTGWTVMALALALVLGAVTPSWAGDPAIDAAKAAGTVGETASGYLAVVNGAYVSSTLYKKVDEINKGRKSAYLDIAQRTDGASLSAVEQLAGKKLVEEAPSGEMVRGTDGVWVKKP